MMPGLPFLDEALLRCGGRIVPAQQRTEWLRSWQAELCYAHRQGRHDLASGLLCDALWLRADHCRQILAGTAILCLGLLALLLTTAALPALFFAYRTGDLVGFGLHTLPRFAVASGLTLFVSYASSFATMATPTSGASRPRLRAWSFHVAKVLLLLALATLVSLDLCLPLEVTSSFAALPLEMLVFVTLALLGLRWNRLDGQRRCRHCLRSLAPPQRIGRPSWNFLEYNGTGLACRDGHGLLTIPELETSWCRSSAWIAR